MTRRPPRPLAALMLVSLLLAVAWAAFLPAFQAPDEPAHFAYVESLGARQVLPGDTARPIFSTAMQKAIAAVNSDQVASQKPVKPEWSDQVEHSWLANQGAESRDDGGGFGPASAYPPTAYLWQAIGYEAASGGTIFDELLGARLMSALWVPVTVLATWLLAGEVFERRRLLQTTAAALPALLPMFTFISSAVSPDGMMYALWALALWLGVRSVRHGVEARDAVPFFAVVGLACTVKPTSYALLPAAALVAVIGLVQRRDSAVRALRLTAAVALPVVLTLGLWVAVARHEHRAVAAQVTQTTAAATASGTNLREFLSYLWQYYLPRTPLQQQYRIPPGGYPLLQVWVTQAWGAFGWLEIKFPPWVYRVLGVISVGVLLASVAALARAWRRVDMRALAFLALAFAGLVGGLHWTDYHQLEAGAAGFMQGRYLFPAISLFGLGLAGALSVLPARWQRTAVGALVAALFVYHLFALGLVAQRFYA